ncbi:MAG: right-handed parallel beta-helix repeat-containing protein [Oscillospiraceae bacterium]|nr:right-handed parallel beta-helix repeat-containing protein [Oscillospiraceae bacterium]
MCKTKRFGSLFLSIALFFTLFSVPASAADVEIAAIPTASTVLVDGTHIEFEAYTIGGNNYFKLRDIAYVLRDTSKAFEVQWDQALNSIDLRSNTAYTPVGGELSTGAQGAITPTKTASTIYLDGAKIDLTGYQIRGNNYFKLRDLGTLFDFSVAWDEAATTIQIISRAAQKEVTVSTVSEFVQAVASNTVIHLAAGTYDFTAYNETYPNGYTIDGVSNLTILGAENGETEFINTDRFKDIIAFHNCSTIRVQSIKAGHTPQEYECDAGVFDFVRCSNAVVDNCYLYGCGSVGISIGESTNFVVENTTITDCSLRGADIYNSNEVIFSKCTLTENRCYAALISVSSQSSVGTSIVTFTDCTISDNRNLEWELIEADGACSLVFNDCTISNNVRAEGHLPYLFNLMFVDISGASAVLNRCTITGNDMGYEYYMVPPVYEDCVVKDNRFSGTV